MASAQDHVNLQMPNVLRDRIAAHRLHPRQAFYEVIEAALDWWEDCGAWTPFQAAPVDGYSLVLRHAGGGRVEPSLQVGSVVEGP